jgi:MoaA/NifB/PqqE/SkfB family radical SAM enzyme
MLGSLKRRIAGHPQYRRWRAFLTPPPYEGARITPRRLINLYRMRRHFGRGDIELKSYPVRLTVEATNVCNLRCPGCFTGLEEVGRERSFMPLELYERLLDEMGPYLFQLELYNWGESLLHKQVYDMIARARRHGISTIISTNFSLPFDAEKAERLVSSGLNVLGVSLDGASQETYEQYRVWGDIETVLRNVRLVNEAKTRLASKTPRLVWEFHVFPHNTGDIEQVKTMARELGMDIEVSKGWVAGDDWQADGPVAREVAAQLNGSIGPRMPCTYLWDTAVINNDGGAAACCGSFYRQDDYGRIKIEASDFGSERFRDVWNNWSYRESRRLFTERTGSKAVQRLICFDCPVTVMWERYKAHAAAGGDPVTFDGGYSFNDGFMFFYERKNLWSKAEVPADRAEAIELEPVEAPQR